MDRAKVVCGCFDVTVGHIEDAIKDGAKSFEDVQEKTMVGTGCGRCIEENKALVSELLQAK